MFSQDPFGLENKIPSDNTWYVQALVSLIKYAKTFSMPTITRGY